MKKLLIICKILISCQIAIANDNPIIVDINCEYNESTGKWQCRSE